MPMMKSLRDTHLTGTDGHSAILKAGVPGWVPPQLEEYAIMRGCIEVSGDLPEVAPEVEAPVETTENEQVDDGEYQRLLNDALTKILVRNDPDDFKIDGMPKVNKVVAEMPLEAPRPTATEIAEAYSELQEDISLAE